MINKQFPMPYDVEQAIRFRNTSYDDLRCFTQGIGLINVGSGKDHIAGFAADLLLEHHEYISIRRLAQGADAATNISGFTLRPIRIPVTVDILKDDIIRLRDQLIRQASDTMRSGAPIQELTVPQIEDSSLRMMFKYQRMIPGRVELMERVDTEIDFKIESIPGGQWRVVCFPQSNQDVKIVEQLFKKIGGNSYEPFTISLERFTRAQRILFFDTIMAHYKADPEWQVREVVEITVRQPTSGEPTIVIGDERDSQEQEVEGQPVPGPSANDLLSISQAILQGKNLRTNSFVKGCESQGFYFPSMTLLLENRNTLEAIQVMIRFKLSPEMFEVVLTDMKRKSEIGEVATVLPAERQQEILKEFWNTSHEIWHQIDEQTVPIEGMRQLALGQDGNCVLSTSPTR